MTFWVIVSWVAVGLLTAINVFIFLKLKQASEQMLKMAFPDAKNMNEAMSKMQQMMSGFGGAGMGGFGGASRPASAPNPREAQLKAAMDMLSKMKK